MKAKSKKYMLNLLLIFFVLVLTKIKSCVGHETREEIQHETEEFGSVFSNPDGTLKSRGRRTSSDESTKVNVTVAYETYCPDSITFINDQLWPTYQLLKDHMALDLLPYGKAEESFDAASGFHVFSCQHGAKECRGNLIQTCAIHLSGRNAAKYVPFIHCMEEGDVNEVAETCAASNGLSWSGISACVDGKEGNTRQHDVAMRTPQGLNYVPTIIVNGASYGARASAASRDLKGVVCRAIEGPKPAPCLTHV